VALRDLQVPVAVRQPVHAAMAAVHPLAGRPLLRLRDFDEYPVGLPTASYGVRHLIDLALIRASANLQVMVEADSFEFLRRYPSAEHLITFQIPIGLPEAEGIEGIVSRPIDGRDVPDGLLYLCQLRGRTLPVAAARFASQLERSLVERFQ
jgi:hypothetical protein